MSQLDGLETWARVPLYVLDAYWKGVDDGVYMYPWMAPPILVNGVPPATALMIYTVADRSYRLDDFRQFHRIMRRDGYLKLVFSNGREEIILEAFQLVKPVEATTIVTSPQDASTVKSNILPFKRKPLFRV